VAQLYPQELDSLFVASVDSQGYGGGIRPRLHKGDTELPNLNAFVTTLGGPNRKHPAARTCLPSRWLVMNVSSDSTIPAFRRHVTIYTSIYIEELGNYRVD
jgi:hypothetical protein